MSEKQELLQAFHALFPKDTAITCVELEELLCQMQDYALWIASWNGTLPRFGGFYVMNLFDKIAGSELMGYAGEGKQLTIEQIVKWLPLIRHAIADWLPFCRKSANWDYYESCFERIEAAGNDPEALCLAFEDLRYSISMQ